MDMQGWDERYSAADRVWSGRPNPWLVDVAESLTPGTALDVGCGEGADAIWLATRGWQVSAVDFSRAGLIHAEREARRVGVAVDWRRQDLSGWEPDRAFDLVSVQFFHAQPEVRRAVHRAAWAATAGVLLVVAHDLAHPGPPPEEVRYSAADITAELDDDADIEIAETRVRERTGAEPAVDAVVIARRGPGQVSR